MPAESTACPSVQIIGIDEIPAPLIPAKAGIQWFLIWVPAFVGTNG